MSKRGGIQILDLREKPFKEQTKQIIAGSYEVIEGNYNKRVILSGLNFGGNIYNDVQTQVRVVGKTFVCSAYGLALTFSDDDGVTISQLIVSKATGDAVTVAQFNNLLTVLASAGIVKIS